MDQTLSREDPSSPLHVGDSNYYIPNSRLDMPGSSGSSSAFGHAIPQDHHHHDQFQPQLRAPPLQTTTGTGSSHQTLQTPGSLYHDLNYSTASAAISSGMAGSAFGPSGQMIGNGMTGPAPQQPSTFQQQLVRQYQEYQQQQQSSQQGTTPSDASVNNMDTLAPSSHLPAHFQASSGHPLNVPDHLQEYLNEERHTGSFEGSATSHKIMMWQHALSNGPSQHIGHSYGYQQNPAQAQSQSQPPLALPASSQPLSQWPSSSASPVDEQTRGYSAAPTLLPNNHTNFTTAAPSELEIAPIATASSEASARPRTLTAPSAYQSDLSAIDNVTSSIQGNSSLVPTSLAESNPSTSSQKLVSHPPPPPRQTATPEHVLDFVPPPIATASVALSIGALSHAQKSGNYPRTIDLNPSANASRYKTTASDLQQNRRTESSASSVGSLQQQVLQNGFNPIQQPTPQRPVENASASSTPMRNMHARFQSASNVRGAPTEAFEGSPAKFFWDPHARMTTMDSIASSQWSPVVNDMYRFVDPLRPNFDFSATSDEANAGSPVRQHDRLPSEVGRHRLASFSHSDDAPPVQQVPLFSSSTNASRPLMPVHQSQQPIPPSMQHRQSHSISSMPDIATPYQHASEQMQHPHLSSSSFIQQQHMPTSLQQGYIPHSELEDLESRRASTATTASSAPLISPQDFQTDLPNISYQLSMPFDRFHFEEPASQYLLQVQEPATATAYGYRDYFNEDYKPSPTSVASSLPNLSYPKYSMVSPSFIPDGNLRQGPSSSIQHQIQNHTNPIALPTAQLERQTLYEESQSGNMAAEEAKRKRTTSKRGSTSNKAAGQRGQSVKGTLAPADDRARRRLSSPVLSVRPNDSSGDANGFSDDDEEDDDDDDDDHGPSENMSSERSRYSHQGSQYGSLPDPSFTVHRTNSAAGEALPSGYGSVPLTATASSSSGSTHISAAAENLPVHPLPPPVDTSGLVRALPDDAEDPDLGVPRQQKLRFSDDWYTPEWVRGESAKKEGFCDLCQPGKWLQLKNSAFWYHRQYTHGISSVSGQPFASPVSFRPAANDGSTEALCHQCNEWIMYTSRKQNAAEDPAARVPTNWFKHAHKCHFYVANRSKNDKPRGKRRKVSSSPDDG